MKRVVIDTNVWIRILLAGPITLRVLEAWRSGRFRAVFSQPLLDELEEVSRRPRLRNRIPQERARRLLRQLRFRGEQVTITTTPPRCRDPKDEPVLATAIDGKVDAIVSGDSDLRTDDRLREEMAEYGVEIWGVEGFLGRL
jgi:putative PIN family toxin of toxin-antitoxin system